MMAIPAARTVPGRVSPVNRRLTLLSGTLLATLALSSCGTVKGDDYVAKVGDETLTRDELDVLTESSTDANAMRIAITNWVQVTAIGGDTANVTSIEELETASNDALLALAQSLEAEAQERYELALEGSPVLCLRVIPLDAATSADDVLAQLEGGLSFPDAVAEHSVDPSLAQTGGLVTDSTGAECLSPDNLSLDLLNVLGEAGAVTGTPVSIEFSGQPLIVLLRPFDDLAAGDQLALARVLAREAALALLADVEPSINDRFGQWDAEGSEVVPNPVEE